MANFNKWATAGTPQTTPFGLQQQQLQHHNLDSSFRLKQQQQQQPYMQQQAQHPALRHSNSTGAAASSDEHLFQTPSDLVCPITLSLFQDPVCNALGQVYEREALQRHLLQAAVSGQPPTDPVSNAILPSLDLVPVWPMRSRAAEYRDSTIRACVQCAAAPDCGDPVKYLRRAAELVLSTNAAGHKGGSGRLSSTSSSSGGLTPTASFLTPATALGSARDAVLSPNTNTAGGAPALKQSASRRSADAAAAPAEAPGGSSGSANSTGVPGLTLEFAQYLASHPGRQYDALVLKWFGNELLRAGCPDAASNVFYRLLLEAEDRVQQAEYLQLCLDCWTSSSSSQDHSISSGGGGGSNGAVAAGAAQPGEPAAGTATSSAIINKLADFVQRQRCLSPRAIIQMLQSTHHGSTMAIQLCQVLLTRAAAAAAAAAAAGPSAAAAAGASEAVLGLPGGLGGVLEVLLELVDLGHGQLLEQVQQLTQQVQQLQQPQVAGDSQAAAGAADAKKGGASASNAATPQAAAGSSEAAPGSAATKRSKKCRGHSWRGGKGIDVVMGRVLRVAAAGTLAAATLATSNHPVLRLARVGPLLYLLRSGL